jgi:hypothetical protein
VNGSFYHVHPSSIVRYLLGLSRARFPDGAICLRLGAVCCAAH